MIPETLSPDCESRAERRLWERLRDETVPELVAFHHVAWLVPGSDGRPRQGEADFVLAHPDHGALALEVKGGTISYDAKRGRWTSTGREGEVEIRNPFEQAENASFRLRDVLARAKRGAGERVSFGHAVAFPDTRLGGGRLGPAAPREIVIDGDDLSGLDDRVRQLFGYWAGRNGRPALGADGVALLERVLANSFELRAPLSVELRDEDRALLRLTEQQYGVLDVLARQPRAAIAGCAGSGKTFLAAEKARRLARQGFRVLVVCFNTYLGKELQRGLASEPEIDVFTYDGLCQAILREAEHDFPAVPEPGREGAYYYGLRETFAEQVADIAAGRYGALVADEAQDFQPDWWLPLQLLLIDPDASPLYVFFDDNQRIFPAPKGLPVPGEPFLLTRNCRNTDPIGEVVASYYEGETELSGLDGLPVQLRLCETPKQLLAALEEEVSRWLRDAEVAPADIALLTAKASDKSALWTVDRLGGAVLTDDPWDRSGILRSSIHRFKGLERLVIACCELDSARDQLFYVGFSRAKVFLAIFCTPDVARRLPAALATHST